RTIHKLLTGLLLLSGVSFAAHAQNPTWGENIEKDSFISRAGNAQQDESSTSTTGFNKGDFFIVLLNTNFFPEYYGAYATNANHTETGVNTTRFLEKAVADGAITKTTSYGQTRYNGNASPYLFNKSVSQVYKLKPLNVTVTHKVKHRRKAHYTNDEYEKNPGKLYAYNGTLSRFIFVERNKQYAFTGGKDSPYNPYKWKNDRTDHLTPNDDAGFCEYGIDPQDLSTKNESQKRAITSDWEAAFGSTSVQPLEAYLSEKNLNAWNEYGVFAFTHDCSGGTWRSHFMHTNIPNVETDIPNSGAASDAQCNAFTASITPTQNNTILVFVPQKPAAPSSPSSTDSQWIKNQADSGTDYGIVPKHAPYIQFYLGKFFPKNEATDVVLHGNDNYVTHKFAWFTNVYDKYNRNEGTQQQPGDKTGIEEFKIYARVEGTETWQLIETTRVRPHTNAHEIEQYEYIGMPNDRNDFLLRKSYTYNMEYKVESTIVDLGVTTPIQTLVLPVPALTDSKSLNLTVFSSSRAVDNVNRATGDSGDSFGTNYITHKLTIIPTGINEVEGDTYTVTRKWDTAKDTYGNEQTIKITINASGQPEITEGMPAGAEWTVSKEAGNIILTLTEIRTADYENDYRNCDKYMVSYTGAT
ncbi:MAG: hypothetical protein HUJ98_11780, partial [Bacteroidaceae bacterium]|nr:hypothetical protein [Bacteroidaceae bacterium]